MTDLPYFAVLGNIPKYFEKIRQAETPANKFSQEFLKDTLGFKSGNDGRLIPVLKSMKFLDESGHPLQSYRDFRSESTFPSKSIATGIKNAYPMLFARDKEIYKASEDIIKGHIIAITDKGENSAVVRLMTQSFLGLIKLADFTEEQKIETTVNVEKIPSSQTVVDGGMKLTYTIVLNLPTTTTKEVYDAIFTSLKENLLNK